MKMIGLFGEARSHDRADLLPLRIIASMANQARVSCETPDRFATLVMASVASACPEAFSDQVDHCHRAAGERMRGGAFSIRAALLVGHDAAASRPPHAFPRPEIVAVPMIQPDRKAR